MKPAPHILAALLALVLPSVAPAADTTTGANILAKRVPWTTSRINGSPETPPPYQLRPAFPKLQFKNPIDAECAPGSGRMFVLEQRGLLHSFPVKPEVAAAEPCLDLTTLSRDFKIAYGITFHPGFRTNRFVYLCYALKDGMPDGTRVSRFVMRNTEPPTVDPASELILITWLAGGHNGGCLKFGPDGYFYVSTGDGAGPNPPDPLETGQDLSDLLSSILRIDVEHAEPGKPYRVPSNNPFVNLAGARPEVWAYGLRNPWKMSFDPKTGELWTGDVGWEMWEMVYRIERGGNYGWSAMEGPYGLRPQARRGPTPILPPVVSHPHTEAASVTGGFFYRGMRLPELQGAYIYGDWATGKMWALRRDGTRLVSVQELLTSTLQIIGYVEDEAGELYTLDYAGTAHLLEPTSLPDTSKTFPKLLSQTGLFADTARLATAPGVYAYDINAEAWADHATATRLVAIPGLGVPQTNRPFWLFPTNSVFAKTFSMEMRAGDPSTQKRVETQVLHFDGANWQAYSYRWNDAQTDATLVAAAGDQQELIIKDTNAPGGERHQSWRYHSRAECLRCHNTRAGFVLSYFPAELNLQNGRTNQLRQLAEAGLVQAGMKLDAAPTLANPHDATAELTARVRAYLHINCSHCHRRDAGGSVPTLMNYELRLAAMNAVGAIPAQGSFDLDEARIVAPGEPHRSVLLYRLTTPGHGHMPLIGTREVDAAGVRLVHDWIRQLPVTNATTSVSGAALQSLIASLHDSTKPAIALQPYIDPLLASTSGALALASEMLREPFSEAIEDEILRRASAQPKLPVRELFEQFLPPSARPKKLGSSIRAETILSLKGNADIGARLFAQTAGTGCQQCHRVRGEGRDFGPDLTAIGKKYGPAQLLEQILAPSKSIAPEFISYQIETRDDLSYTGFVIGRTLDEVVLKDAQLREVHLPKKKIASERAQPLSAMPEGLLQNLTTQEAADLLAYLVNLK